MLKNKKFEYVDDNPGEYFDMLCEGLDEDRENKTIAKLSNGLEIISYPYGYAISDGYRTDRFIVTGDTFLMDDGAFRLSNKDKEKILNLIKRGVLKESLKEDKFIPQDKMSKKDQKELNDKKRGTWGSTKPVTRVQPNKKAYDRKRDKKVIDESKKLNESSDGWDESKLYDLSEILDEIYNLQYEIKNTVRGAYTNAYTYEELGNYIHNLGHTLMFIGDDIAEVEEDDEEDED